MQLIWWLTHKKDRPRPWWLQVIALRYRILPRPFDRLLYGKHNLVGAEVGVFGGDHAVRLLETVSIWRLYLVDSYIAYDQFDEKTLAAAKTRAHRKMQKYPRAQFLELPSVDAAPTVDCLDFCYIDGAHDYDSVKSDIEAWWPRLKPGGILGGHDFDPANQPVIQAVIEFAVRERLKLYALDPDWWIFKP